MKLELVRKIKSLKHYFLIGLGVLAGRSITGPLIVQIDLTNKCNNRCIACWCRSPFLKDLAMSPEEIKQEIPFKKIEELVKEFNELGVREVYLTGGGEPFMHSNSMQVIKLIKKYGMRCAMSTNFTLLSKKMLRELVGLGVDEMNISIWAATAETYNKTHLGSEPNTFFKLKENLKFLNEIKKVNHVSKPFVNIHNVLMNVNAHEFNEMIKFAFEVGADSVDFTPVDIIPKKTSFLQISKKQAKVLLKEISELDLLTNQLETTYQSKTKVKNIELLKIRLQNMIKYTSYDNIVVDSMPCYAGWTFARIMANGNVIPCLKAHRIPSGNIFKENFKDIWYGEKQNFFRKKTFKYKKEGNFFKYIGNDPHARSGCKKECDNIEMNAHIHKLMAPLLFFKKLT